jgi:hypothetical protein
MVKNTRWWVFGGAAGLTVVACIKAPDDGKARDPLAPVATAAASSTAPNPVASATPAEPRIALSGWRSVAKDPGAGSLALFDRFVEEQGELDYKDLAAKLKLTPAADAPLPFDPTSVRFYAEIAERLKLTPDEKRIFRRRGVVGVDHEQRYSMGSAYHAIYTRDLPVLVTGDSILHALHRSFDESLKRLEIDVFTQVISDVLSETSKTLAAQRPNATDPELAKSFADVDLYLTVARNLLAGAGAPKDEPADDAGAGRQGALLPERVAPKVADEASIQALLKKVASLELETPLNRRATPLYGGTRHVDWSQFRPRGHYTESTALRRYFRTMMWLGRVDLGWNLRAVDPVSGVRTLPTRELRNAALFTMLLDKSGRLADLDSVSNIIDFMVGRADNVSLATIRDALAKAGVGTPAELASDGAMKRLDTALDAAGARAQQVRGQVVDSDPTSEKPTDLPLAFQVFGQRFVIDSFVLSRVVYDGIVYRGEKQERFMPSGLDAMAALGNDEATRLLATEIDKWHYATNLLAARRVVDRMTPDDWKESAYTQWISALRTLDDTPSKKLFPAVMKGEAWRRKQLQTALASWAELRHDTILYAKQSYTAGTACEYPAGFVEPYPEFFERVRELTSTLSVRLSAATLPQSASNVQSLRQSFATFFENFSKTMEKLRDLANAELSARPFTKAEADFLKQTIDIRGGGSGGPFYTGWYPRLIIGTPDKYKPTVADVHTDPNSGAVLEEGVGDVNFVVVAVDNGPHRMAYVGPIYSFYEFTAPAGKRMTNEEWRELIQNEKLPARPEFARLFQPPGVARTLDPASRTRRK